MNNNNTAPSPCPSPTREGRTAEEAASLPSLVGENRRGSRLSPLPCRGGAGGGVSIVIIHVCFRLFEKFAAKVLKKSVSPNNYALFFARNAELQGIATRHFMCKRVEVFTYQSSASTVRQNLHRDGLRPWPSRVRYREWRRNRQPWHS